MCALRLGIDVGGTFTDLVLYDERRNKLIIRKISTTPNNPEVAVLSLIDEVLKEYSPNEVKLILHATTLATNALLGQKGLELPKGALITTKGFRDILEIGRQRRPALYDLFVRRPKPLIPRRLRFGVEERMDAKGNVIVPLNEEELRDICHKMRKEGVKVIAICFLNSYVNPVHELKAKEIVEEEVPDAWISLSCEVDPEHGEYERTSTTVVNALLMPLVAGYIRRLEEGLFRRRVRPRLLLMKSSGGAASAENIVKRPIDLIESGPAAGVSATAFLSKVLGIRRAISFDMGGTTAKAGVVIDYRPRMRYELGIGRIHRGEEGEGFECIVRSAVVDLAECSAGGGSIAWVDEDCVLRVGPISAGAEPGPACYGKGGKEPTVTDANLVLGRLPAKLLAGDMTLYPQLARKAIEGRICKIMEIPLIEAAKGILRIANYEMANIIRLTTTERGLDPREFTLIAYGGAGPLHATDIAEELGINKVIIPRNPGNFSAYGLIVTDVRYDYVKTLLVKLEELDPGRLEQEYQELEERALEELSKDVVAEDEIVTVRYAGMRYYGQSYEIVIPVPLTINTTSDIMALSEEFLREYGRMYMQAYQGRAIELVDIRVSAFALSKKVLPKLPSRTSDIKVSRRDVYFISHGLQEETPIYRRDDLAPGFELEGPAIVEEYGATLVVNPGWNLRVDEYGNIILER